MATYLILNLVVILCIISVLTFKGYKWFSRQHFITLAILLLLTLIFDNLIIMAGIVAYDPERIMGVFIGRAPIEDFFYAIAAAIVVPFIWHAIKDKV